MTTPNSPNAYILGVGLTPFIKPRGTRQYPELGLEACTKALLDANLTYDSITTAIACYCYGDTTSGQRIFYQLGMTGIPVYNTNNACATGSTGLHLARQLVKGGLADAVLVCGFEQMQAGSIKSVWGDRPSPMVSAEIFLFFSLCMHRGECSSRIGPLTLWSFSTGIVDRSDGGDLWQARKPEECAIFRECGEGVYGQVSLFCFFGLFF